MYYQLFVITSVIFEWLLVSLGMFIISGKLNWEKRWQAWIPGLRFKKLGNSVAIRKDGTYCGIMDILFMLSIFARLLSSDLHFVMGASLFHMIMFVFMIVYKIRFFVALNAAFGLRKRWLILWIAVSWLPMIIVGLGKKYQPNMELLQDEKWEAGTEPTRIEKAPELVQSVPLADEGLSIQIRERTARDSGKKRYLLKDIALNIPKKSLVLLLGGSGAGKTTMINAVIGYEKANATVLLNGTDIYKHYKSVKHQIGFVPQQNLIRGKDTVEKTIKDAAEMRLPKTLSKEDKNKKMDEVLDLLGLSAGKEGLVSKKSGGQLRRICIAMELVTDPELFVLDEPDSGLDGVISREIFSKLRKVADEDRIVMVITHTPDRVIDLFDKVIVLGRDSGRVGRLAFYGSPDEAKEFFGKDSMEQIVMSVNSKDEGGEGMADEFIEKYAAYAASLKEGAAS